MRKVIIITLSMIMGIVTCSFAEDDLEIKNSIRQSHSTQYFGVIDFTFYNNTQDWMFIESVKLTFDKEKINKNVKFTAGQEYQYWMQATQNKIEKNKQILAKIGFIVGTVGAMTAKTRSDARAGGLLAATAIAALSAQDFNAKFETIDKSQLFPPGHLFRGKLVIPPGLLLHRFIVINTRNHDDIGFLETFNLEIKFKDGKVEKRTLNIRESKDQYGGWQKDVRPWDY